MLDHERRLGGGPAAPGRDHLREPALPAGGMRRTAHVRRSEPHTGCGATRIVFGSKQPPLSLAGLLLKNMLRRAMRRSAVDESFAGTASPQNTRFVICN
jgi:hypothetical protein